MSELTEAKNFVFRALLRLDELRALGTNRRPVADDVRERRRRRRWPGPAAPRETVVATRVENPPTWRAFKHKKDYTSAEEKPQIVDIAQLVFGGEGGIRIYPISRTSNNLNDSRPIDAIETPEFLDWRT